MDDDQKDFVELLFNLGKLSGSLMRPAIAEKMATSMADKTDGPRLTAHMKYLHKRLGELILVASMQTGEDDEHAQHPQ